MSTNSENKIPPILDFMVDLLVEKLVADKVPPVRAREIALHAVDQVREAYGGDRFYMPKGLQLFVSRRDREIWNEFKDGNKFQLAKKHGLTVRSIELAIARVRDEEFRVRQGALDFGEG